MLKDLDIIRKECEIANILHLVAKFTSYNDSIFGYEVVINDTEMHEFTFICDDTLLSEMKVEELLNLRRLAFFSHRVFIDGECIGGKDAVSNDNSHLN